MQGLAGPCKKASTSAWADLLFRKHRAKRKASGVRSRKEGEWRDPERVGGFDRLRRPWSLAAYAQGLKVTLASRPPETRSRSKLKEKGSVVAPPACKTGDVEILTVPLERENRRQLVGKEPSESGLGIFQFCGPIPAAFMLKPK